jgi:ATP-dependent DNA helicase RecG
MSYPLFHPERGDDGSATLTLDDFQREFPEENQFIEFKKGVGRDQLQESVVAFSNAEGGVILIGVADDGEVVGRTLDAGTADKIHQVMRDVYDPGRYSIHAISVDGREAVAVVVAARREGFAQMSDGVVRIRKGTRDEPLFGSELQQFLNSKSSRRYELTPTDVAVSAADSDLLAQFAEAFSWGEGSHEGQLTEAGYAIEGRLTVAGALFLIEDPAPVLGKTYVELLRFRDESVDYDLRLDLKGPLPKQLRMVLRRALDELGTELVVLGMRRFDLPRVPMVVLREAIANALAHRSYELNRTSVRVEIRPSSVNVLSPGGLPEPVTVANIRETSAPRNIAVITALRRFGLAEDAGRGIDVMESTMLEEMLDTPRIEDHGHQVAVTLPTKTAVAPEERAWVLELEQRGHLEGRERLLLVHAARGEALTNAAAREILDADQHTARTVLQRLRDVGFLEQQGSRGGATYNLNGTLRPPAGLRLDPRELAQLVVDLASEVPISNADVRKVTGLERNEVRALLAKLVKEQRLIQSGERRGTRYRTPLR